MEIYPVPKPVTRSSSSGQFARELPGTYKGGSVDLRWPETGFVGEAAEAFIAKLEGDIARQVGGSDLFQLESPFNAPANGSSYTVVVYGISYKVSVQRAFSLWMGGHKRWSLRLNILDVPLTDLGKPPVIVVTAEQWVLLKPFKRQIVTIRNGRQGETMRQLQDGRLVVKVMQHSVPLYWEIYTQTELDGFNPRRPFVGYENWPMTNHDLPWQGYPSGGE